MLMENDEPLPLTVACLQSQFPTRQTLILLLSTLPLVHVHPFSLSFLFLFSPLSLQTLLTVFFFFFLVFHQAWVAMTTKWNVMLYFTFAVSPHAAIPFPVQTRPQRGSHTDAGFNQGGSSGGGGGWGLTLGKVALLRVGVWSRGGFIHNLHHSAQMANASTAQGANRRHFPLQAHGSPKRNKREKQRERERARARGRGKESEK